MDLFHAAAPDFLCKRALFGVVELGVVVITAPGRRRVVVCVSGEPFIVVV